MRSGAMRQDTSRHYGMDWLRIGAFALLILYHTGMVLVPWPFQVKTAHPLQWVTIPMLATNAWRLMLLFVVSGYASRALLARSPGLIDFVAGRSRRLLVPLIFGMAVIVPPQSWVELTTQHGYTRDFIWFWTRDYFRFGALDGVILPTWNHLWFVVYLWLYTIVLTALVASKVRIQPLFDRIFAGDRALWVPLVWLLVFQVLAFHRGHETHDIFGDGVAHLAYLPAFLFGFGLRGSPLTSAGFARHWRFAAVVAVAAFVQVALTEQVWPGALVPPQPWALIFAIAREVQTWASIAALIGIADRYWNHDHRWRATLCDAVFPFYIIHQTIIVVVEGALLPLHIGPLAEFAVIVTATVAGCWTFYLLGKHIHALRPLIGLNSIRQRPKLRYPGSPRGDDRCAPSP